MSEEQQEAPEKQFVDMTGTWPGVATGEFDFGVAKTGTEQVHVMFEITDGPFKGRRQQWSGSFTPKSAERTMLALRYAGWKCDDILALTGLGSETVDLVFVAEDYQDEESGEWRRNNKINWVNRPSRLFVKNQMDEAKRASFASRMAAAAVMSRQRAGVGGGGSQPASSRTATNGQAGSQRPASAQQGFGGRPAATPQRGPKNESGFDPGPGADADYADDHIPF